jgi:hypothetical protein
VLRAIFFLALAAVVGVVGATSSACVVGLATGTDTWCGFPLVWPIGIIFAVPAAVLFGVPADLLYRKAGLRRWWQFVVGGSLLALPFWYELAQPFTSSRWQINGFFDSLNYLGSGAIAGLAYWWLRIRCAKNAL